LSLIEQAITLIENDALNSFEYDRENRSIRISFT
jgi:hypothetical protein